VRQNRERWMELAARATEEQDPEKLMEIIEELNVLLEEKERRLGSTPPNKLFDKAPQKRPVN